MAKTNTASTVIARAGLLLGDVNHDRYNEPQLISWIADGQQAILTVSLAANVKRESVSLIQGFEQTAPSDCYKIVEIPRNTSGDMITLVPDARTLFIDDPAWTTAAGDATVLHVVEHPGEKGFTCYPTQPASPGAVDMVYAAYPVAPTQGSDTLGIENEYLDALVNYVVYRALSQDDDNTAQPGAADARYAAYLAAIPGGG